LSLVLENLKKLADHDDEVSEMFIFWANGKIAVSNQLELSEFNDIPYLSADIIENFFFEINKPEHNRERRSLFNSSLRLLKSENRETDLRIFEIISRFTRLNQIWNESYDAFLHNLDIDEMREKFISKIEETENLISGVLAGSQIRILAIPLAIMFALNKLLSIEDDSLFAVYAGLVFIVLTGFILFINSWFDVISISNRHDRWVKNMKDSSILTDFKTDVAKLATRIRLQKFWVVVMSVGYFVFSILVFLNFFLY
jgi:hypothetical protein